MLFPEVPSHLPVLQYNVAPQQGQEGTGAALPPIPPVQIPTDAACQLSPQEQQRNSSPSLSASASASASSRQPAAAPAPSVQAPPPDYSILYSQPRGAQPKAEPAPQVIEAYPVLPEEEPFSYPSAVQAQPYRGGPATATAATVNTTSTTTSSNTAAAPAPSMVAASTTTTRRSLRDNEETKEYQPAPPVSFTQQLRNFMHEVGDVIMEVSDEVQRKIVACLLFASLGISQQPFHPSLVSVCPRGNRWQPDRPQVARATPRTDLARSHGAS